MTDYLSIVETILQSTRKKPPQVREKALFLPTFVIYI